MKSIACIGFTMAVVLAACGLAPSTAQIEGAWRLTSGEHEGRPVPVLPDAGITMNIDGTDVGGTAACNHYGGTVELNGDRVAISALSMTAMGCPGDLTASQDAFLAAIGEVETVSRQGDRLVLAGPETELTFDLVPPVADADLVGPTWVLDSLFAGDAVSSVMGEAMLNLAEDGTISGFTGCRTFDGDYAISGTEMRVTGLTNDDRACTDDLVGQDNQVLEVLNNISSVEIDGQRLTLRAGALGLSFVTDV